MKREELRKQKGYIDAMKKIKGYPKGFEFDIPYYKMTQPQRNAMYVIVSDCIKDGIIESLSIDLNLEGEYTSEKFRKL